MKTGPCVPVCFRETLTEVAGRIGVYWRCRDCGRAFFPEKLYPTGSDDSTLGGGVGFTEDQLNASKRYRIPTTVEGQTYELRRMFRR